MIAIYTSRTFRSLCVFLHQKATIANRMIILFFILLLYHFQMPEMHNRGTHLFKRCHLHFVPARLLLNRTFAIITPHFFTHRWRCATRCQNLYSPTNRTAKTAENSYRKGQLLSKRMSGYFTQIIKIYE